MTKSNLRAKLNILQRLRALEAEAQENRQLNRRIAELTDLVTELLVPAEDRDDDRVETLIADYRKRTLAQ